MKGRWDEKEQEMNEQGEEVQNAQQVKGEEAQEEEEEEVVLPNKAKGNSWGNFSP